MRDQPAGLSRLSSFTSSGAATRMTTMAWMTLTNSTGMLVVRLSSMVPARSAPNTMPAKMTPTGLSAARAATEMPEKP